MFVLFGSATGYLFVARRSRSDHCILTRLAPGKGMEVTGYLTAFCFTGSNASYVFENE